MNIQTKTKYLDSSYPKAPQINNAYGSLVNFLNIVLVEGFNENLILGITKLGDNKLLIKLPLSHGYIKDSVIKITGSTIQDYNTEYRVQKVTTGGIEVYSEYTEAMVNLESPEGITIKFAPLGFERVYVNTGNTTMCFKNASVQSPGILKVIDEIPGNGYKASWGKFARVVIGQEVDAEGNFINNKKAPCHTDFPNAEYTGNNGTSGSTSTIYGFAKWNYAKSFEYYDREEYGPSGPFPRFWELIGDDKTFYFFLRPTGSYKIPYGFGNFISESTEETYNLVLQAKDGFISATDTTEGSTYDRHRSYWPHFQNWLGQFTFGNIYGQTYQTCRYYSSGMMVGTNRISNPWKTTNFKNYNPVAKQAMKGKLYIRQDGFIRGYHRGVETYYGSDYPTMNTIGGTNLRMIAVSSPDSYSENMPLIFSMEDWEEWP